MTSMSTNNTITDRYNKLTLRQLIIMFVLLWSGVSSNALADTNRGYELKAAFLYNFARFTSWPENGLGDNNTFLLCMGGKSPFGDALSTINGKHVHGKELISIEIGSANDVAQCDMLFIGETDQGTLADFLEQSITNNILTVAEAPGFAKQGGMIELIEADRKIRFDINIRTARKAGLDISSRLLKLAREIYGVEDL